MSTHRNITVTFTEVQLKAVATLVTFAQNAEDALCIEIDGVPVDIRKGIKAFDKAINKSGYYREFDEIFKLW